MTDFRRPDLDLLDEESDENEDALPTVVALRPLGLAKERPSNQTLAAGDGEDDASNGALELSDPAIEVSDSSIEITDGSLELSDLTQLVEVEDDTAATRDGLSVVAFDDPAWGDGEDAEAARVTLPRISFETLSDGELEGLMVRESKDDLYPDDEAEPTVSVRRSSPSLATSVSVESDSRRESRAEEISSVSIAHDALTPPPGRTATRLEDTQRIEAVVAPNSIAPATRTQPPQAKPRRGLALWQAALVALAMLGVGYGYGRLKNGEPHAASAGTQQVGVGDTAQSVSRTSEVAATAVENDEQLGAAEGEEQGPSEAVPAEETGAPSDEGATADSIGPSLAEPKPAPRPAAKRTQSTAKAPKAAANEQDLPSQPSRDQVSDAFNALLPTLKECTDGTHGRADVTVTVRSTGAVSHALVSGAFAGTPAGTCIAKVVRSAKLPAFSDPMLRVSYPFQL